MTEKMRVALADDQASVRSALRLLLEQEPDFEIVVEAADATGLLAAVVDKQPDLLLLDWELPGLPVLQLLRLLRYEQPAINVIAMSSLPEACRDALDAGVHTFVNKSAPPQHVLAAVRNAL